MELYIHIPFCLRKCNYCDFLSFCCEVGSRERYVAKLIEEIENNPYTNVQVETVFIGGGTPSILTPEQIARILHAVRKTYRVVEDAEISMEANPGTFDMEKLVAWKKAGINRLSMGLQSANDQELKLLGRIHDFAAFEQNFRLAREAGFDNLNIDLMSALPGQTMETYRHTLETVLSLKPEHISSYSLIIEPGTPLYEEYAGMRDDIEQYGEWENMPESHRKRYDGMLKLPGEAQDRAMYAMTKELLSKAGYSRYEVSNYAQKNRESRHNLGYWTGKEYLGLGLGASSMVNEKRFSVTEAFDEYLALAGADFARGRQYRDIEQLTVQARMEEFMFLGLRLTKGVSKAEFRRRFQTDMTDIYGDILKELAAEELIQEQDDRVHLTEYGMDISNYVLAKFLL